MNRSEMIRDKGIEMLKENDDLFVEVLENMDSYERYLGDDRCYSMYDIDDLLSGKKPSEILGMATDEFNSSDNYFYFTIYGIASTDYPIELYRDNYDESYVFDDFINNRGKYVSCSDGEFTELCDMYDEYEGCDTEEYDDIETEEEFLERLENL